MSMTRIRRINANAQPRQTIRLFLDRNDDGFVFVVVSEYPSQRKPRVDPIRIGCGNEPTRYRSKTQAIETAQRHGYHVDQHGFVTR